MEKLRYYDGKCGLMLYYSQTSGLLKQDDKALGYGYAGHGTGLNNPDFQAVKSTGPIPRGKWEIGKFFDNPGHLGRIIAALRPVEVKMLYGRGGFFIHGDNSKGDNSASDGCIILSKKLREFIRDSGEKYLVVHD